MGNYGSNGSGIQSVIGGIFAAGFGIFWISRVAGMGAPPFFALFGVVFVIIAVGGVAFSLSKVTGQNRQRRYGTKPGDRKFDPTPNFDNLQQHDENRDEHSGDPSSDNPFRRAEEQSKQRTYGERQQSPDESQQTYDDSQQKPDGYQDEYQQVSDESRQTPDSSQQTSSSSQFEDAICLSCGNMIQKQFSFCPHCGKDI